MFTFLLVAVMAKETFSRIKITFFSKTEPAESVLMKPLTLLLLIFFLISFYGSFVYYLFFVDKVNLGVSVCGGAVFVAGIWLRNAAIKSMGPFWSFHLEIKRGHRLIRHGPYARLRHPYSVAVLLELSGFALITNAWPVFFVILGAQLPLLLYRVREEEKILFHLFQDQYAKYAKESGRFFPKIF